MFGPRSRIAFFLILFGFGLGKLSLAQDALSDLLRDVRESRQAYRYRKNIPAEAKRQFTGLKGLVEEATLRNNRRPSIDPKDLDAGATERKLEKILERALTFLGPEQIPGADARPTMKINPPADLVGLFTKRILDKAINSEHFVNAEGKSLNFFVFQVADQNTSIGPKRLLMKGNHAQELRNDFIFMLTEKGDLNDLMEMLKKNGVSEFYLGNAADPERPTNVADLDTFFALTFPLRYGAALKRELEYINQSLEAIEQAIQAEAKIESELDSELELTTRITVTGAVTAEEEQRLRQYKKNFRDFAKKVDDLPYKRPSNEP